ALTLQPVCCSNGVTQLTFGSFEPFSAYPGQARTFSWPSGWPSAFSASSFGGVKPCAPGGAAEFEPDVPHAATSRLAPRIPASRVFLFFMATLPGLLTGDLKTVFVAPAEPDAPVFEQSGAVAVLPYARTLAP